MNVDALLTQMAYETTKIDVLTLGTLKKVREDATMAKEVVRYDRALRAINEKLGERGRSLFSGTEATERSTKKRMAEFLESKTVRVAECNGDNDRHFALQAGLVLKADEEVRLREECSHF